MLNALKTPLALVDHLIQHPFPRVHIRMPDPVGVPGVELVDLRHLPGGLLQLVEELQIR
jgi:hypothetical protein